MSTRAAIASGFVTAGLVLAVVWVFEISLSRAAVLAPVIVVCVGAAAGVVVLWAKVGWESLKRQPPAVARGRDRASRRSRCSPRSRCSASNLPRE